MSWNPVLDVAVGLIFMYLILSLMCTAISEIVASLRRLRAKTLQSGLKKLLNDSDGTALYSDVISHPLIKRTCVMIGGKTPSYISAHNFTVALVQMFESSPNLDSKQVMAEIESEIQRLDNEEMKQVLIALLQESEKDFERFKQGIAAWFDDAMDRLTGVYKRNLQKLLFLLSLLVAVGFNADTISVASKLWGDAPMRAEIARAAGEATQTELVELQDMGYAATRDELKRFPLGWSEMPSGSIEWVTKVVGILMTTLALALGASFWFDVLQRVNAIRSAGPKPAKGLPSIPDERER